LLSIKGPCDENQNPDPDKLINTLSWTNPNTNCNSKDAIGYRIYSIQANVKTLIGEITDINQTTFEHHLQESIPTCYQVTAFDSLQNECFNSDSVCVKYCPKYKLPNTFTPNGDNHNDLFKPYPYLFIDKINMKIFNRWGNLVFTTTDPHINWDGTDLNGRKLSDGVYYYQCDVYYTGFQSYDIKNETITGFIEMLSGKN
jgi:gliding motility-associated-like protein